MCLVLLTRKSVPTCRCNASGFHHRETLSCFFPKRKHHPRQCRWGGGDGHTIMIGGLRLRGRAPRRRNCRPGQTVSTMPLAWLVAPVLAERPSSGPVFMVGLAAPAVELAAKEMVVVLIVALWPAELKERLFIGISPWLKTSSGLLDYTSIAHTGNLSSIHICVDI